MRRTLFFCWLLLSAAAAIGSAQTGIAPEVRTWAGANRKTTVVDVAPHFVTTIQTPAPVNAVAIGDSALFQVEHSEKEPKLVFVKALTTESAQSNLLISLSNGEQMTFLLVSRGNRSGSSPVDFLLRFRPAASFLVEPNAVPFALVPRTAVVPDPVPSPRSAPSGALDPRGPQPSAEDQIPTYSLDDLLQRQEQVPLPELSRTGAGADDSKRLRVGISEVLDAGQQVLVVFSVINNTNRVALLMPPQIQLGGKDRSGKLIKHERWSTAEQLPVIDFRLSHRRIGPGERADGVVLFERPPYKQSTETLLLQVAEAGAVDKPALVPIGFGVSTSPEVDNHAR